MKKVEKVLSRAEAEQLLCFALGCERLFLYTEKDKELGASEEEVLKEAVSRRLAGEPLQYIIGTADFMGLEIKVDPRVLIPRPETELLAEEAAAFIGRGSGAILDLCTGSGCLAAYLAGEFPAAKVTAADISEDALIVARENCPSSVRFVKSDLFENIGESFDLIVSNPPYISSAEIETLAPEVKDAEPRLALDGGASGLDIIGRILKEAPAHLNSGGALLMEIGYDQGPAARRLALANGFSRAEVKKDLNALDRILIAF